jgi:hypothetical protein
MLISKYYSFGGPYFFVIDDILIEYNVMITGKNVVSIFIGNTLNKDNEPKIIQIQPEIENKIFIELKYFFLSKNLVVSTFCSS